MVINKRDSLSFIIREISNILRLKEGLEFVRVA
jgi:hypothetical protein